MKIHKLNPLLDIDQHLGRKNVNSYLILDGSRFKNIYKHLYEYEDSPDFFPLFKNTQFESILEVSPCLVKLKNYSRGILPWFLKDDINDGKGWIFSSPLEIDYLISHFQNCLIAVLPDKRKVLFRFYDPNVLHLVANCSNNETWLKLTEPCSLVIWPNNGNFYEVDFMTLELEKEKTQ